MRSRASLAVILLMDALAICTVAGWYAAESRNAREPGTIVMDEARFRGVRAKLPPRGTIGYISDISGQPESTRAYYLTQYFLAPVVVAPDVARELVVANLRNPGAVARVAAQNDFILESDFRNGVALLGRRAR